MAAEAAVPSSSKWLGEAAVPSSSKMIGIQIGAISFVDVFRKDLPNIEKTQERDLYGRNQDTLCVNNPNYRNMVCVTNLSLGGCYVKAQATCPKGTILELVLEVGKTRLHAHGRVAAVNPTNGMGIEFTSSERSISHLPALINAIRSQKS